MNTRDDQGCNRCADPRDGGGRVRHIGRLSGHGVPREARDERGRTLSEAATLGRPNVDGMAAPERAKAWMAVMLIGCIFLSGCSPEWKKKFIRKRKKDLDGPQAILVLQPDHKAVFPAAIRYKEHYAFWKSWHGELLDSFGQIRKRDIRYMDGVIGELQSMQILLSGQPAQRLRQILVELSDLQAQWERTPSTGQIPISHRGRLESLQREIGKSFHYSDVKDSILPDPEPAEAPAEKPAQE